MVDLIGNQLDLYRKNQADIGVNVMITLSSEERDERLKSHLLASKELHPALLSPHSEHKVIKHFYFLVHLLAVAGLLMEKNVFGIVNTKSSRLTDTS